MNSISQSWKRPVSTLLRSAVKRSPLPASRSGPVLRVPLSCTSKIYSGTPSWSCPASPWLQSPSSFHSTPLHILNNHIVRTLASVATPPQTMRALRYHGIKDLRVDNDIPVPECGEYQIKIKRKCREKREARSPTNAHSRH
jgi:hypothetical protein